MIFWVHDLLVKNTTPPLVGGVIKGYELNLKKVMTVTTFLCHFLRFLRMKYFSAATTAGVNAEYRESRFLEKYFFDKSIRQIRYAIQIIKKVVRRVQYSKK